MPTMNTLRSYAEILAAEIGRTEGLAHHAWQRSEDADDPKEADAWAALAERLFAEADALREREVR